MAKKKKGSKRKPPQKVRTQFMAAFTKRFIGKKPTFLWPVPGQLKNAVAADFETFLDVLITAGYVKVAPTPGAPGSLRQQVIDFLTAEGWPNTTPIPTKWQGIQPTIRLIEISVLSDRLLEAVNAYVPPGGSGGGPSGWPPH